MRKKKIIIPIFCLLVFLILTGNCRMDAPGNNCSVTFGFTSSALSPGRNVISPDPEDISAVLITVRETASGDTILNNVRMPLYWFNSAYISDAVDLVEGNYTLTHFLVIDSDDNVIYAAPQENAPMSNLVTSPLPLYFSVSADTTTAVRTEVLALTSSDSPQDYGYTEFGFNIVIPPKYWESSERVDSGTGEISEPLTTLDDYGRSITIWKEKNGSTTNLWANRYTPQAGWDSPQLIDELNTTYIGPTAIKMDNAGNAIVVYTQKDLQTNLHLWAKRYVQGSGWQDAEDIATYSSGIIIEICNDATGKFLLTWSTGGYIYSRTFEPGTGWDQSNFTVYNPGAYNYNIYGMSLDMNDNGDAALFFFRNDDINCCVYHPESGWSSSETINSLSSGYDYKSIDSSINNDCEITIAYSYQNISYSCIIGNQYTEELVLQNSATLDRYNSDTAGNVSISKNNRGNAIVTWSGNNNTVRAAYFDLEFGWQPMQTIFTGSSVLTPLVVINKYNYAVAMWFGINSESTQRGLFYSGFSPSTGWEESALIEEIDPQNTSFSMSANSEGQISTAWLTGEGDTNQILTAFYK